MSEWTPMGEDNEKPMRYRTCWLALPDGVVVLGFFGRAGWRLGPLDSGHGEMTWRHIADEETVGEPVSHWAYVKVPAHPEVRR